MRSRQRDIFTTIRTEGAILPSDLLQRIAAGAKGVEGLDPSSYHLAPGEKLSEAINRSWNRLVGIWAAFKPALAKLPENDFATSLTRERLLLPLFQELGYGRLLAAQSIEIDGKQYPVSHSWQHTPIHLVGWRIEIDRRTPGVPGAAKTTPHGLVQELLNRAEGHLWGVVSNGRRLRLLRDNKTLTRQAYVEFDLEAMMDGEIYSDFSLLWLLVHQSRVEGDRPEQCWLEKWSRAAQQQGTRALDQLRVGVEKAISALGSGFLAHTANQQLREKLRSDELTTQDYYRQLLRMVYRLLFLFAAEDRELLLDPKSEVPARERYLAYFSTGRLRRLAERRRGTDHPDLFHAFRLVIRKLGSSTGCPELALPALGSFLFSDTAAPDLDRCEISNRDLLDAVRSLAITTESNVRRVVDYKNIGAEELGSVYESLLELHPTVNTDAGTFKLKSVTGSERKTSGSYYTPDSLVQCLLDSALDPVLNEAARKSNPEEAILNLKVCDPACGSGHFLIAAAHRMAKRLAAVRTGDEEPSPEATRKALRNIIGRCIYGVDINPMAVELCKVSLWMEALDSGRPLNFLDAHIQCGNSLLGATPELIAKGIPDEAFTPIEGDDKKYCSRFKKENRREFQQESLFGRDTEAWERLGNLPAAYAELNSLDDSTPEGVTTKESRFAELVRSTAYLNARFLYDTWCSAFVWKKSERAKGGFDYPITNEILQRIERNPHDCPPWMRNEIILLRGQYQFFHWQIAFPEVFARGGFECVLGNPPWDKIQPEEEKFFATMRPDIAQAETAKVRKELIARLPIEDPSTHVRWVEHKREIEGLSQFLKSSGAFRFTGEGNLNSYRAFTELSANLVSANGRSGLVVQTGLATDESGKELFDNLLANKRLMRFLDFENRQFFFTDVDQRFRFSLITLGGRENYSPNPHGAAEFGWLLHSLEELGVPDRLVQLSAPDLVIFNPSSRTCPVFSSVQDFEVSKVIYRHGQHIYINDSDRLGEIDFLGELFNMTRDSSHFNREPTESTLPLYEAKYIHQFDHRFASSLNGDVRELTSEEKALPDCVVIPKSWVERDIVNSRAFSRGIPSRWMAGFRDIASATNERTAIMAVFPFAGVGNSINMVLDLSAVESAFLIANVNAAAFDFCARQKISGTHVNIWIFKQLPAIPLDRYDQACPWSDGTQLLRHWVLPRVSELVYTAWDLEAFAQDCEWTGPPFRWDDARRFLLRCELDAAFFHLYLGSPEEWRKERDSLQQCFPSPVDAVKYIMETFPIVKRRDEEKHGCYRTRDTILQIYDEMADAMRTGKPYKTRLEPPPGPPTNPDGTFATLPNWPEGATKPANWPPHIHEPRRRS